MDIAKKIQEHKAKVKNSKWAVWSWIVLAVLFVGYVVFAHLGQASDRRLLAKLKHERDVNEEKKAQAITADKITSISHEKALLREEILARSARSAKIDEEIELRRVKRENAHARISQFKDWNDISSNIVFRSKSSDS